MPDNEIIALLRLYGNVIKIDGRVKLIKTAPGIYNNSTHHIGDPRGLYLTLEMWMQRTVEDIEAGK